MESIGEGTVGMEVGMRDKWIYATPTKDDQVIDKYDSQCVFLPHDWRDDVLEDNFAQNKIGAWWLIISYIMQQKPKYGTIPEDTEFFILYYEYHEDDEDEEELVKSLFKHQEEGESQPQETLLP